MSKAAPKRQFKTLEEVRARIDRLDDAILDGVVERVGLLDAVAEFKAAADGDMTAPMRPGREALILRRLLERAGDDALRPLILKIWREIIGGAIQAQAPMKVHISAQDATDSDELRDLARDHFGASAPLVKHDSYGQLIGAISAASGDVGVVSATAIRSWLSELCARLEDGLKITGAIPMIGAAPLGYIVAVASCDASGDDRSLIAVEFVGGHGGDSPAGLLVDAGCPVNSAIELGGNIWLCECDGFISDGGKFTSALDSADEVVSVAYLGGYPALIAPGGGA